MSSFIQVPSNLEDPQVLKSFLTSLVDKLNSNPLVLYPINYGSNYTGTIPHDVALSMGATQNLLLEAAARTDALKGDVREYITNNLETVVLQNTENIALVTEQFGTYYSQTQAAAWYGLGVKAGEVITGLSVGAVDTDTTVPGGGNSFFAINADSFQVARALEDITDPAELNYVQQNSLPYGTMYDAQTQEYIPAFQIDWNGASYDIYFNGKVTFTNLAGSLTNAQQNDIQTNLLNNNAGWTDDTLANSAYTSAQNAQSTADGKAEVFYQPTAPIATLGDIWVDTDDNNKMYVHNGSIWVLAQDYYTANQNALARTLPSEVAAAVNNNTTTINGSKITTGTLTALQIATGTIVADKLAANTITADKLNISELSAISANIGTITAGTINADVVNAGVLNLDQIPDITIDTLVTATSTVSTVTSAPLLSATHTSDGITRIRTVSFSAYFMDDYTKRLFVYRGSTLIWTHYVDLSGPGTVSFVVHDQTSGTHTYSVEAEHTIGSSTASANVSSRELHIYESKK